MMPSVTRDANFQKLYNLTQIYNIETGLLSSESHVGLADAQIDCQHVVLFNLICSTLEQADHHYHQEYL